VFLRKALAPVGLRKVSARTGVTLPADEDSVSRSPRRWNLTRGPKSRKLVSIHARTHLYRPFLTRPETFPESMEEWSALLALNVSLDDVEIPL
jgi:hypothetical protein